MLVVFMAKISTLVKRETESECSICLHMYINMRSGAFLGVCVHVY